MFKNCEKSTRFNGRLSFQLRIEKTDLLALNIEQALVPWNASHNSIANHHQTFRSSAERNAPPISNNIRISHWQDYLWKMLGDVDDDDDDGDGDGDDPHRDPIGCECFLSGGGGATKATSFKVVSRGKDRRRRLRAGIIVMVMIMMGTMMMMVII